MADRERTELGPRKSAVLRAVVEQYVSSGEPVGSETIAEAAGLGVSSATIRNEMAALEEQGYLSHPHTSAGRIPTDAGYRHYVDALPAGGKLRDAQRRLIAGYFTEAIATMCTDVQQSTQVLRDDALGRAQDTLKQDAAAIKQAGDPATAKQVKVLIARIEDLRTALQEQAPTEEATAALLDARSALPC